MSANNTKYATTGTTTINGTDWPVQNKLSKDGSSWLVTIGICNGTAESSEKYPTKRAAVEAHPEFAGDGPAHCTACAWWGEVPAKLDTIPWEHCPKCGQPTIRY